MGLFSRPELSTWRSLARWLAIIMHAALRSGAECKPA
jgi:hypothetical protein